MINANSEIVKAAMKKLDRRKFVPELFKSLAKHDCPLPIAKGQTISQPSLVGYMTEALHVDKSSKVLEIGTGSGYQAALLAELVGQVFTVEIIPELAFEAKETLSDLGYKNIFFKIGDGNQGWKEQAPFDAIIVTAAAKKLPKALIEQLKPDGRLIIPMEEEYGQGLYLYEKNNDGVHSHRLESVRFVPMVKTA